jgi:hypothetical protein
MPPAVLPLPARTLKRRQNRRGKAEKTEAKDRIFRGYRLWDTDRRGPREKHSRVVYLRYRKPRLDISKVLD